MSEQESIFRHDIQEYFIVSGDYATVFDGAVTVFYSGTVIDFNGQELFPITEVTPEHCYSSHIHYIGPTPTTVGVT